MLKTTVDLTIAVVEAEADHLLHSYPYYPYQRAFSAPSLRQKLIAYVLSRLPNLYGVIEAQAVSTEDPLHCPSEQQQQIEVLVHRGIHCLLIEGVPHVAIEAYIDDDLDEMNVGATSSHWFR
jgi:hypothetical protein